MAATEKVKQGVGILTADILARIMTESFPGLEIENAIFKELRNGSLTEDTLATISAALKRKLPDYKKKLDENPYIGDTKEVAKRIVGSPFILIKTPGNVEAGLIIGATAYSGKGDPDTFTLPQAIPGTLGIWSDPRRGGYAVTCISAHLPGEKGYIAINSASIQNERLSMNDITERLEMRANAGLQLADPMSPIKIALRGDSAARSITGKVGIYAEKGKGEGAIAAYRLEVK